MPHGNKRSKMSSNSKKKGNKGSSASSASSGASGVASGAGATSSSSEDIGRYVDTPRSSQFSSKGALHRQKRGGGSNTAAHTLMDTDSLYNRYKKCTQRVKDALMGMVPDHIFQYDSGSAIEEATDYIVANNLEVQQSLLYDLAQAIHLRKMYAHRLGDRADDGHAHFIDVLDYCWSHLRFRAKKATTVSRHRPHKKGSKSKAAKLAQRLEKLSTKAEAPGETELTAGGFQEVSTREDAIQVETVSTDDDGDESGRENGEGDSDGDDNAETDDEAEYDGYTYDENDLPKAPTPRPIPSRLTLQELISGSDRTNCNLLLFSLDELMGQNAEQFTKLKEAASVVLQQKLPPSTLVAQMMKASMASNLTIQQVLSLEESFIQDHPHLNTVYRVFAVLSFLEHIQRLTAIVTEKSPLAPQFTEKHAVEFIGDAIESDFRDSSDPLNKGSVLVKDFLERWQLVDEEFASVPVGMSVQSVFNEVTHSAMLEEPSPQVEQRGTLNTAKSWIPREFIGNNRPISNTIRLLQPLWKPIQEYHGRLILPKDSNWGDRKEPFTRLHPDMDELLMGDIMPSLVNICYEGMMSTDPPYEHEIFTGLAQIKTFVDNPQRPVTWSIAFTIHTILTSIIEVQGSNHSIFLAETARLTFEKYIGQSEWVAYNHHSTIPQQPPIWNAVLRMIQSLQQFSRAPMPTHAQQTMRAFWNPYCAGALLSYLAYHGNLEGGTMLVDSVGQLKMTLHLFNALKKVGAIQPGQVELLDRIFRIFKFCKEVWQGESSRPAKGQFRTRWLKAYSSHTDVVKELSGQALMRNDTLEFDPERATTLIDPERLSKSYRRVCLRDFLDVVDRHHRKSERKRRKHEPLYKHAVRVNDTLEAMSADTQLLALNLVSLGFYLNQFYIDFFVHFGWMAEVERKVAARNRPISKKIGDDEATYLAMVHIFANRVMRALDARDASMASRCAEFMKQFFKRIRPEMVTWFTPPTPDDSRWTLIFRAKPRKQQVNGTISEQRNDTKP